VSIDVAHVLIIFVDFNVRWYSISVDITLLEHSFTGSFHAKCPFWSL